MRFLPLLLFTLAAACSKEGPPSLDRRIEDALKERLAAARGSDEGVVLTDDTPRANIAEQPAANVRRLYLRGASLHVPLDGLAGLSVGAGKDGLTVRLGYGQGSIEILDSSGEEADREFESLRKVGEGLWEEILRGFGGPLASEPGAAEKLEYWRQTMPAWDKQFARRFDTPHLLQRFALKVTASELPDEIDEIYRDGRLLRVKRAMIATMGGGPEPAAYAVAAGPTVGIRRGVPGRDPEVRSLHFGPDGMTIRVVATGSLPAPLLLELLDSLRPVQNDGDARRRLAKTSGPVDAALAALAALHLDPSVKAAVQFLHTLAPLQPDRRELAEALAVWLKADDAKRGQLVAAAQ